MLDVRNLNEYEAAHIKGALNIPVDELRFRLDEVPAGQADRGALPVGLPLAPRAAHPEGERLGRREEPERRLRAMLALGGFESRRVDGPHRARHA